MRQRKMLSTVANQTFTRKVQCGECINPGAGGCRTKGEATQCAEVFALPLCARGHDELPMLYRTACARAPARSGFRPVKMSDRRLSDSLLPGQNLFGLSEQRNTEVVQLLRTLQLS